MHRVPQRDGLLKVTGWLTGSVCLRAEGVLTSPRPYSVLGATRHGDSAVTSSGDRDLGTNVGSVTATADQQVDVTSGHFRVGRVMSPQQADVRSHPALSLRSVCPRPSLLPREASVSSSASGVHSNG